MRRSNITQIQSSKLLLLAFLLMAAANFIGSIILLVATEALKLSEQATSLISYALMLVFQAIYVIVYIQFKRRNKVLTNFEVKNKISLPAIMSAFLIAVVTFFGCIGPAYALERLFDLLGMDAGTQLGTSSVAEIIMLFVCTTIAAPVGEELIFRDGLISGLRENDGEIKAALISAACFMLMHTNPYQTAYQFILGFVSAITVIRLGSVVVGMIIHSVSNCLAVLMSITTVGAAVDKFYSGVCYNVWTFVLLAVVLPCVAIFSILIFTYVLKKREQKLYPFKYDRIKDEPIWIDEKTLKPLYDESDVPQITPENEMAFMGYDTHTGEKVYLSRYDLQKELLQDYEQRKKNKNKDGVLKLYVIITCVLWLFTFITQLLSIA